MDEKILKISVGGAAIFAAGVGLGFILGSRRRKETILIQHERLESKNGQLEFNFNTIVKESHDENDIRVIEEVELRSIDLIRQQEQVENDPAINVEVVHTFARFGDDNWDYDEEMQYREQHEDGPYIIHYDEYINNEMNFTQDTLTYFSGDNIVCDTRDIPMYGHELILGDLRFGHGSNDPNIVYIRNVKLHQEWEILFTSQKYEDVVIGLRREEDLADRGFKHGTPRFRRMDY